MKWLFLWGINSDFSLFTYNVTKVFWILKFQDLMKTRQRIGDIFNEMSDVEKSLEERKQEFESLDQQILTLTNETDEMAKAEIEKRKKAASLMQNLGSKEKKWETEKARSDMYLNIRLCV